MKKYKIMQDEILNKQDKNNKKELLLHSCCAPCSSHVITYLKDYFNITILYYNPNIEPIEEYNKRKKEQIKLINILNKENNNINILDCDYENEEFIKISKNLEHEKEGGARCNKCFYLRIYKTASMAKELHYDYFGTTLTVSPYKNSQIINEIGLKIEKDLNINYLVSDFKKEEGYKRSIELSKKYNLYRQHYCGCHFAKEMQEQKEIHS